MLVPRRILPLLKRRLETRPIVVVTGARQTGKTTLVRDLLPRAPEGRRYVSFDDPEERIRYGRDALRLLGSASGRIVLDEVQKLPGVLDAVKLLADRAEERRFILLGSAQILLLEKVRETLAGRAALLDLYPLSVGERADASEPRSWVLDAIAQEGQASLRRLQARPPNLEDTRRLRDLVEEAIEWGGYPALLELPDNEDRRAWLRDYRRTYLERDLRDIGQVADLDRFSVAQELAALRTAQLLSYSDLARDLGVAPNTAVRYVRFLEISYQVHLLKPWFRHATKRLVKSPKIYWTDPGLARVLAGPDGIARGALYETFLLAEVLKWRSFQTDPPEVYFYRTYAGSEVDILLVGRHTVVAIEAKSSRSVSTSEARRLAGILADPDSGLPHSGDRRVGLIVYRGDDLQELRPGVWAMPDALLFGPGTNGTD